MPITSAIQDLFLKWGVDPYKHQQLVIDLMKFVYDELALESRRCNEVYSRLADSTLNSVASDTINRVTSGIECVRVEVNDET
jgi:hypothetical protein